MAKNDKIVNKYAKLTTSASGDNEIVAAYPSGKIVVLSVVVTAKLANDVKFKSGSTDISCTYSYGANGGMVLPFNENGWGETAEGEALNLKLASATQVGITINYTIR